MRRKRKQEQEQTDSWLLPYSDLMTLLLALFIVLFASSSVDAQKFQSISKVFGEIFSSGTGVFEYANPIPEAGKDLTSSRKENEEEKDEQFHFSQEELEQFLEVKTRIDQYIISSNLEGKLQTSLSDEGLLLTINDSVLFDSGSAEVRETDLQIAQEISNLLVIDPPHNVIITGHTDNVPIKNSNFDSNWELSVTRAVNFMKIILENEQLDPRMFSAKGFGEYQPVASNDTAEGRQRNRRVEVLILPNNELVQQNGDNMSSTDENEKDNDN